MLDKEDPSFFNLAPSELLKKSPCQGIHLSDVLHSRHQRDFYDYLDNRQSLIHLRVRNVAMTR